MNKNNSMLRHTCQTKNKKSCKKSLQSRDKTSYVSLSTSQSHAIGLADRTFIGSKTSRLRRAMDFITHHALNPNGRRFSVQYFMKVTGYSRRTIEHAIHVLKKHDIITGRQLGYNVINTYGVGAAVMNPIIRNYLVQYLPSLRTLLCISFLMVFQVKSHDCTLNFSEVILEDPILSFPLKEQGTKTQQGGSTLFWSDGQLQFNAKLLEFYDAQPHEVPADAAPLLTHDEFEAILSPKKDISMASTIDINPAVDNLSSIKLTLAGKIALNAYPTEAINEADKALKRTSAKRKVDDPFTYLCGVASKWTKDNGRKPNWNLTDELKKRHGITPEMPTYEEDSIAIPVVGSSVPKDRVDWEEQRRKDTAQADAEGKAWEIMTYEEKKDILRPAIPNLKKVTPGLREGLFNMFPYPGAKIILQELLLEDQEGIVAPPKVESTHADVSRQYLSKDQDKDSSRDLWETMTHEQRCEVWRPLAANMAKYTPTQRYDSLKKHGLDYGYQILEEMILELELVPTEKVAPVLPPPPEFVEYYEEVLD